MSHMVMLNSTHMHCTSICKLYSVQYRLHMHTVKKSLLNLQKYEAEGENQQSASPDFSTK